MDECVIIKLHTEFDKEHAFLLKFYVAAIPYAMIIGMDIMSKFFPITIDTTRIIFTHNRISFTIEKSIFKDTLHAFSAITCVDRCNNRFIQWFNQQREKHKKTFSILSQQLQEFTSDNPLAFWEKSQITIKLPIVPNANPTKASHSGMSPEDYEEARNEIDNLLHQGLITPSTSPWACKAFFVNNHAERKCGKKRLVINYKPLNQFLIANKFPLPLKDSLVACLKDAQVFYKFDLKSGFWQFKIAKEDCYKTTFVLPHGHYEWNVMPIGLAWAPIEFQQWGEKLFSPYQCQIRF